MIMTREQAIFFETMEDLDCDGSLEPLFFAYHYFIIGVDLTTATDLEIHRRAKECILRYKPLLDSPICLYNQRRDIIDILNLDDAEWEYLDYIRDGMEIPV